MDIDQLAIRQKCQSRLWIPELPGYAHQIEPQSEKSVMSIPPAPNRPVGKEAKS